MAPNAGQPPEKPSKLLAEWFLVDRWAGSSAFLLPLEARGLYREMLSQAWRRGAKLPNNPVAIQRAVACTPEEWARSWPEIKRYWRVDGDSLVNDTQIVIYADALGRQQRACKRAQAGAQAGAQARAQARAQAVLKQEQRLTDPPASLLSLSPSLPPSPSPSSPSSYSIPSNPISLSPSLSPSPIPSSCISTPLFSSLSTTPPPCSPSPKRSSAEQLARALKAKIGCGLDRARDQIHALVNSGLAHEAIFQAIERYGVGGMPPWEFTAKVTGYVSGSRKGMTAREILEWGKDGGS